MDAIGTMRDISWRERLEGLVPRRIEDKLVLIIGCGSVGSYVASALVRSGIRKVVLIDPDKVEVANLTRTVYLYGDIGAFKVDALRTHLSSIFPDSQIEAHPKYVQDFKNNGA